MADPARNLFDEFKSEGIGRIDRCLSERQKETLFIDFKQSIDKENRPTGELTEDGRKLLAENISAFANSGGGVLVWGIRDKGHYAEKKIPIPNVNGFVVQLYRATQQATAPPMDGVEHIGIEEENGAGYAVTYVPDGKAKPYMAVQTTEQYTYFMRSGDSSKPMPDVLVRALVMAGERPSLKLRAEVIDVFRQPIPSGQAPLKLGRLEAMIKVILTNDGRSIADRCAFAIEKVKGLSHRGGLLRDVSISGEDGGFSAFLDSPKSSTMYPGTDEEVLLLFFSTENTTTAPDRKLHSNEDLSFRYAVFANGFAEYGSILILKDQLLK